MASGNDSYVREMRTGRASEDGTGTEYRASSRGWRRMVVFLGVALIAMILGVIGTILLFLISNFGSGMNWAVILTSAGATLIALVLTRIFSRRYFLKAANDVHVTGRRVLATVVDGLILLTLGFVLSPTTRMESWLGFAYFSLVVSYYVLLEGYLGQTLGKKLLGIKVIRQDDGGVPGLRAAAIRTLLRALDSVLFYLVAFIAVLQSESRQRIGDVVARTLVVAQENKRSTNTEGPSG